MKRMSRVAMFCSNLTAENVLRADKSGKNSATVKCSTEKPAGGPKYKRILQCREGLLSLIILEQQGYTDCKCSRKTRSDAINTVDSYFGCLFLL